MRTRNEKLLLGVLIGIVVVAANYYGYLWLAKKQVTLERVAVQLRQENRLAADELQKEDDYAKRRAWIQEHEPALGQISITQPQVLEDVLKGARDNKLTIVSQNLGAIQPTPAGTRINVTVTVKGPMQGIAHWLAELQKPTNFYAVASFSLKVDAEDEKAFDCKLDIGRYFKTGS